jgi:hypothetical protein
MVKRSKRCKICRSSECSNIEFCRFHLGWSYPVLLDTFGEDFENLNGYNLSTHFNNHVDIKFYRDLKDLPPEG